MASVAAINNLGAYAHNPRGNLWFKDESTYGHKLLMKMGWRNGKGLGKNENGIKENLSVKFRNTNSGLGYKDDPYANVLNIEYESILKSLSATCSQSATRFVESETNKEENKKIDKKSRVVKGKPRYPKLFFGKDVSKYSEKDMKSIFICSLPSNDKEKDLEDSVVSKNEKTDSKLSEALETYSSSLSISEYFAKKMKEKKNNVQNIKVYDESDQEKFSSDSKNVQTDDLPSNRKTKKRKKNTDISTTEFSNDLEKAALEFEMAGTDDLVTYDKKLSPKKTTNDSESTISQMETSSLHTDEIESESSIPKKKKRKLLHLICKNDSSENSELNEVKNTQISNCIISSKKQKISKLKENEDSFMGDIQHNTKISCQIQLSSNAVLKLNKKSKKLKDKGKSANNSVPIKIVENSNILNIVLSSDSSDDKSSVSDAVISKRKKKFKKMKLKNLKSCLKSRSGSYSMKNVSFNESVSYQVIDSDTEFVECLTDEVSVAQNDVANEIVNPVVEDENDCCIILSTIDPEEIAEIQACNSDSPTEVQESISDEKIEVSDKQMCNSDSVIEIQEKVSEEESKAGCSLSGLPTPKSAHYTDWVESQRLALKMKIYKQMLKRLKKHEILGTTNLPSIKGYGNWGFK